MKILIGTPIHVSKDYCMERWLQNVAELIRRYPADLLLVDNSPGRGYAEKVRGYCVKYGLKNYKIEHLELSPEHEFYERINRSREIVRREVLSGGYGAWFSWECDQFIPTDALDKLVGLQKVGNFMIVAHNNWRKVVYGDSRGTVYVVNFDLGVSLVSRECLEKYGFLLEFGADPEMPSTWEPSEEWLRKRILRGGGGYIEVQGLISPILHIKE